MEGIERNLDKLARYVPDVAAEAYFETLALGKILVISGGIELLVAIVASIMCYLCYKKWSKRENKGIADCPPAGFWVWMAASAAAWISGFVMLGQGIYRLVAPVSAILGNLK